MRVAVLAVALTLAASAADAQRAGQWTYRKQVDPMTSKSVRTAAILSTNSLQLSFPYHGPNHGLIRVRERDGTLTVMVAVSKGQIMCNSFTSCDVLVRFDQDEPIEFTGSESSDNDSSVFFLNDEEKFLDRAKTAKRMMIRFTMFHSGQQTLTFNAAKPLVWE